MAESPRSPRVDQPRVLVVVLNWRSATDSLACLAALKTSTYANQHLLVVDNASGDGSLEAIRAAHPDVEVLALERNLGYAGGNNRAIAHAGPGYPWVWLLNPDTMAAPDCLAALVEIGERDARIGFLGPLVMMREAPDHVWSAGGVIRDGWSHHRGMDQRDQGQFAVPAEVDYVMGCALLVRRQVIETVGLLDESYFLYGEEADWCWRAHRHGFSSVVVPAARVLHPNTALRDAEAPLVTYYMTRNQLRFIRQHRLGNVILARNLYRCFRTLASWTLRPKWRNKGPQRRALRRALIDFARGRTGPAPE